MISRTNVVLAVVLVLVLMLTVISRVDYSRPNIEILPDMKYTPAFTSYAENPNFSNGRTLQAPVPGTIARGTLPLHYEATEADALRAGEELQNPFSVATSATDARPQDQAADPAPELRLSVVRGGAHYRVFCISCHGPIGAGDGPIPQRGFPPPPSMLTGKSLQMKDGQLFHIVTFGQGSMAGFAGQLSPVERWDVINYVRSLQPSAPANQPAPVIEPSSTEGADEIARKNR
jgi:mono/diheme cytochrome c family protein